MSYKVILRFLWAWSLFYQYAVTARWTASSLLLTRTTQTWIYCSVSPTVLYIPSALESRLKSWLCSIFSTTSSASTLVSSTRFSWDSTESCFIGHLWKQSQFFKNSFLLRYENKKLDLNLSFKLKGYLLSLSEAVSSLSAVSRFGSAIFCSTSSQGSKILSIPVDVLPTEVFLLWQNSEKLDDREWHVLYPVREKSLWIWY